MIESQILFDLEESYLQETPGMQVSIVYPHSLKGDKNCAINSMWLNIQEQMYFKTGSYIGQ